LHIWGHCHQKVENFCSGTSCLLNTTKPLAHTYTHTKKKVF